MPVLEEQLICASNLAYAIVTAGEVPTRIPFNDGCALIHPIAGFATGSHLIDAAFVGSGPSGVVLAFRGTLPVSAPDHKQMIKDWLDDLEATLIVGDNLPGRVHRGFLDALDVLWPAVSQCVTEQLALSEVKRLIITGHSKGGAMAHLAAARFALSTPTGGPAISVRTFEGAHPGDQAFADGYQRLVPDAIRYEYQDDLVPHLPPSILLRHFLKDDDNFRSYFLAADAAVDYAPAGRLQFIDWDGNIREQSTVLSAERLLNLSKKLAALQFDQIVADHSIDINSGCLEVVWPAGYVPPPK